MAIRDNKTFLSYRHVKPDEDLARKLHAYLTSRGVDVFLDREIPWGERWDEQVARHLDEASYFVVLVSEESILSDMVREEVRRAHQGGKKILPVWIGSLREPPYALASWLLPVQHVRWQPSDGYDSICARLLQAVDGTRALPEPARTPASFLETGALGGPEQDGAPLPWADPRAVMEAGAMRPASPFYVRRKADDAIEEQLSLGYGRTAIVRGPRQSGKSSLLARVRGFAGRRGQAVFYIDLQQMESALLDTLESLLGALAARIGQSFAPGSAPVLDTVGGLIDGLTRYVEQTVLQGQSRHVVFALDEVDRVFRRDYREDFFAALRSWHNRRATEPAWANVTLMLGHSTDPAQWIEDPAQSPFNVADEKIWMEDFGDAETAELHARYGGWLNAEELLALRKLMGGQPYLLRQSFYAMRKDGIDVAGLASVALAPKSPFADHLGRHLAAIRQAKLEPAVRIVLQGKPCDEASFQRLYSAGLVSGDGPSDARIRCRLYELFLRGHLK